MMLFIALLALTGAKLSLSKRKAEMMRPVIVPECVVAAHAARTYNVTIRDIDRNGVVDINDIGPQAIIFGMHWADTNRDNKLDHDEIDALFSKILPWEVKLLSVATRLFTSKYSSERVFTDCDADKDRVITIEDYQALRYTTCLENCGKAEDVFNYIGIKFGAIPVADMVNYGKANEIIPL